MLPRRREAAPVGAGDGVAEPGMARSPHAVLADVTGLSVAFALAVIFFRDSVDSVDPVGWSHEVLLFAVTMPGWILLARLHGLYDRDEERASHSTLDELVGVFHLVTVGAFLFFAGAWVTGLANPYPWKLLTFWALAIGLVTAARVAARALRPHAARAYIQNAVIVGADEVGRLVARKILDHPEYGVNVVGFVDAGYARLGGDRRRRRHRDARGAARDRPLARDRARRRRLLRPADRRSDRPRSRGEGHLRPDRHRSAALRGRRSEGADSHARRAPAHRTAPARHWRSSLSVSGALDVLLAGLGLVFLAPARSARSRLVKLDSRGLVFYRHERVGRNGRRFRLIKFRTMYLEHCVGPGYGGEAASGELARSPRSRQPAWNSSGRTRSPTIRARTRLGRMLRRVSLDELPQLLNVLRGDMSLVGPRPVTEAELSRYGDEVSTLVSFRPGVTGYWQVNGRSRTDYEDVFASTSRTFEAGR